MFKKSLAAVAILGAFAGSAMAANVTMYGVIDTGLMYSYKDVDAGKGGPMKVSMASVTTLRARSVSMVVSTLPTASALRARRNLATG